MANLHNSEVAPHLVSEPSHVAQLRHEVDQ